MTRTEILRAALLRFASVGYAETSLKDIAGDVGIKAPSIYAHFSSKEELFAEVSTASIAEHKDYFTRLISTNAGAAPADRLRAILLGVQSFYDTHPELVDFHLRATIGVSQVADSRRNQSFRQWDMELYEAIRGAYSEGRSSGDFGELSPEAFTAHFLCVMDGLFLQLKHYGPELYTERLAQTWHAVSTLLSHGPTPTDHSARTPKTGVQP